MFIKKNIDALIEFILEIKKINPEENIKEKVSLHFFKIDFVVKTAIVLCIICLNVFSLIFNQKLIYNISNRSKYNIIKKTSKLFNFLITKSLEAIHALVCIHAFNSEKLIKRKNEINIKEFHEFIVIGSGPGGSITANKLNKNFPNKTLLIDRGYEFDQSKTKHSGEEFYYKWRNGGITSSFFPLQISFSSGSCVGGGSEINSGLYHEPDTEFLMEWVQKYDTKNLKYNDVKIYTDEIKDYLQPSSYSRNNIFEKNFKLGADLTKKNYQIIPRLSYKNNNDSKNSTMLNTYLKDYKKQGGKILEGFQVSRIFESKNGWKVEGLLNNKKLVLSCKYIFLCCGSIYTNSLLKKSLKISRAKNFNFHPMIKIIAKYPNQIQNINEDVNSYQITSHYPDFIIGNAASSKQFMLASVYDDEYLYENVKKNWRNMTIFHSTFSFGEGKVINLPIIDKDLYYYNINNSNLNLIKNAIKEMSKFVFKSGATEIILISSKNKQKITISNYEQTISSIKKIKQFIFSSVHILGGVKMGENNDCIADSFGKIKDFNNLYVNDSSLINNKLLKNPQGTVMTIALRNIDNFIQNYKKF